MPCNFYYETNISILILEHYDLSFACCWNTCLKLKVETLWSKTMVKDCGQGQGWKHQNDAMLYLFLTLNTFSRLI